MIILERLIKFAVGCWTLFVGGPCLIFFFVHDRQQGGAAFAALLAGMAPLAGLIWFLQARRARWRREHGQMLAAAGVAPGGLEHGEDDSGIAVNAATQSLTLSHAGRWKTYSFADVRRWETNLVKAGVVVGSNLAGATAALGANLDAARAAKARTGLFVDVRDVDRPRWRIAMGSEAMQARWMEILDQEINESRPARG